MLAVGSRSMPHHFGDAVHFEVERPGAVGQDVVLRPTALEMDTVGATRKQVDRRCAMQREVRGVHGIHQLRDAAIEQNDDVDFGCAAAPQRGLHATQLDERKALRKGEVFLQQAITMKRAWPVRHQSLLVVEAHPAHVRFVDDLAPRRRPIGGSHHHGNRMCKQLLVQLCRDLFATTQKERQPIQRQPVEVHSRGRAQTKP